MLEQFIFETLRGASVCIQPSTRSTAYCLARLAGCVHCAMHRGQAGLDRHQPVSILVETSGCCCCRLQSQREQTHLPASQSISVGGSTRSERAGPGVWVGTSGPVDCLPIDGRPPTAVGRISSPRGLAQSLMPRNNLFRDLLLPGQGEPRTVWATTLEI